MDEKFLQDIKEGKHLTSFGMSQENVDSAKESSKKYYIKPRYDVGSIEHRMESESNGIIFLADESSEVPEPFDWEGLKERLVQKGMKFSTMTTEMPREPLPSIVQSVTSGIEPRFHKIFKNPK